LIATIAALVAANVEIDERAVAGMTAASVALVISIPEEMESVRSPLKEAVRLCPMDRPSIRGGLWRRLP